MTHAKIQIFERINNLGIVFRGRDDIPEHELKHIETITYPASKKNLTREEYLREIAVSITSCDETQEIVDWDEDIENTLKVIN
jgi:hypothetical protein